MNIKKTNLNFVLLDLFDDENDLAKAVNKLKPKYLITKSKKFSSYIKINPLSYFSSEEISKREIQAVLESEKIVDKFKNIPFVDNILMESTMYNFNDHNLKTIRSYLFVLDKLITNSSQELLFFIPKTSTSCRVYLYEGEGETQIHGNKLIYRKSDYLPAVITSFLEACNQNYKNYNYGKRLFSNVELFLRQRVRVYGRLILKSFYVIITSQKIKIKNFLKNGFNKKNKINSDKIHIFLTRSTAHAEYLEDIINEIPEKTILLVTSLYKKHKTHFEYCNMINLRSNVEDLYQYNNTKSSLKKLLYYCSIIFLCDLFCIFRKPLNYFKFNNKVFRINLSQFFIESLVKKFESELIIQSINNYFLLNKIKPISFNHCELTSQHQRFFYEFIKSKFPKCLINQISFWSEKNFILERTRYIYSDKLYTFDLGHAKDLKKFWNNDQVSFCGNAFLDKTYKRRNSKSKSFIYYYSQPYQLEQECSIISNLYRQIGSNLKFISHPRLESSHIKNIIKVASSIEIIDSKRYFFNRKYYDSFLSIAITRTSNVAYRLIITGYPVILFQDGINGFTIFHNFQKNYPLVAENFEQIFRLIEDPNLIEIFNDFRKNYLDEYYINLGVAEISNSIIRNNSKSNL